jgi:hypothetical protein
MHSLSLTTHYSRPAHIKKCKLGFKYNKSTNRCKRFIWPLTHTRNVKKCPKGSRRAKKTNQCIQKYYLNPSVIADYGSHSN